MNVLRSFLLAIIFVVAIEISIKYIKCKNKQKRRRIKPLK